MFDGDHGSRECQVMDVSLHGAKIVANVYAEIGSRFRLSLVPGAPKWQPCEVVWRRAHVKRKDWILMPAGKSPVHSDTARDIALQGYCFFQVVAGE